MTAEARVLATLARRAQRRRAMGDSLLVLAVFVALWLILPGSWPALGRVLVTLLLTTLLASMRTRLQPKTAPTARDYARHLDARFEQLEDSTTLLLDSADSTPLVELQREKIRARFATLERTGQLAASVPAFPWRSVGIAWGVTAACALLVTLLPETSRALPSAAGATDVLIERSRVTLQPPAYIGVTASTTSELDFNTFEDTEVLWDIALNRAAQRVQLVFHDGETLELEKERSRRWTSPTWPARSSVYRIMVDDADIPNGIFRIDAQPDQTPRIRVAAPDTSVRVLARGKVDTLNIELRFEVTDDYGITQTQARMTLARGKGEQVRFREEAIELTPLWSDDRTQAQVTQTLDLLALGMEAGDELYLFAQATDNRAPTPNVGTSDTYIVRWPGPDEAINEAVATLAVPVLPEFFRSQRQIIIDSEKLIAQRPEIDDATFAQRAQDLAIDQKLLRLRYGQYLGEEDDSGIGPGTQISVSDDDEDEADHEDHDHAGHADEAPGAQAPAIGDAKAVIALNAHVHDQAEQATLFEPTTRELLRRALAQMWDAELHLRLADPASALPFEYLALDLIKQVRESDRVYLRRTGFRPTPIDEERRLTGELDEVTSRNVDNDPRLESQDRRLRSLLEALSYDSLPETLALEDLTTIVRQRALSDVSWLPTLGAMERLVRDSACADCRNDLTRDLWRQLDNVIPTPAARPAASHPIQRAYDARRADDKRP